MLTLNRDDWKKSMEAWERVQKQATIDLEQSELFIEACKKKMKSLPEVKKEEPKPCISTQ